MEAHRQAIQQAVIEQQDALENGSFQPLQAQGFSEYLQRLKQLLTNENNALHRQEQRVQEVRETLKQALIKQKSLEILKEKDYAQFLKKLEQAEEAFLSELALNRLHRQSKG